ncbi:MAG: hypothetical protein LUG60_09355 [Erysipelotrichaceae bacterium]|nr:hypothetical protein [Erysipelotrichaceae bacterium]
MFYFFIVIGFVIFGIIAIVGSIIGGTSVLFLVKNDLVKKLLLVGFGLLLLFEIWTLMFWMNLSQAGFIFMLSMIDIGAIVLTSFGIYLSNKIENRIIRIILLVLFIINFVLIISQAILIIWLII